MRVRRCCRSWRNQGAIAFVEVNDSVKFRSRQVLAPGELSVRTSCLELTRDGNTDLGTVECERFSQHSTVHRPGRFDSQNPQYGRRDINIARGKLVPCSPS